MQIIEFYSGEGANNVGVTLEEIMQFNHGQLEMDHDYIQWLFPSNEPSQLNGDAPVLTEMESLLFKANPELQEKVKQSFIKMLDFFGFQLIDEQIIEIKATADRKRPRVWLDSFNHNMLRVTRILKSLRLTGLDKYADRFYKKLSEYKNKVSENTFSYWTMAATGPLVWG